MPTPYIENPELNRPYLIRSKINGDVGTRFQPAIILDIEHHEARPPYRPFAGKYMKVHWLHTGQIAEDVMLIDGHVRALTDKWLKLELEAARQDLRAAEIRLNNISLLDDLSRLPHLEVEFVRA